MLKPTNHKKTHLISAKLKNHSVDCGLSCNWSIFPPRLCPRPFCSRNLSGVPQAHFQVGRIDKSKSVGITLFKSISSKCLSNMTYFWSAGKATWTLLWLHLNFSLGLQEFPFQSKVNTIGVSSDDRIVWVQTIRLISNIDFLSIQPDALRVIPHNLQHLLLWLKQI